MLQSFSSTERCAKPLFQNLKIENCKKVKVRRSFSEDGFQQMC